MFGQALAWAAAPVFPGDDDKTRRAAVLNISLLCPLALIPVIIVGDLLGGRVSWSMYVINAGLFVACLILKAWMRRGAVRLVGRLLLAIAIAVITSVLALLGTVRAPTAAMYLLVIVIAGLLEDLPGMVAVIGVSMAAIVGIAAAERAGLLPIPDFSVGITQVVTYGVAFVWAGSFTYAGMRLLRQTLAAARTELEARLRAENELARHLDQLEDIVQQRTRDLSRANDRLRTEIDERARTETALRETLAQVKTLSGILPICMHCRKVRNDDGYWQQVEAFVRDHTEAEFSHGICPECLAQIYPNEPA